MDWKIAIVDDLREDRERLSRDLQYWFLHQRQRIEKLSVYPDGKDILAEYTEGMFDIIFLDICMDEVSGIETARQIRQADSSVMIIFLTTSREYAFDAFPLHSFDYIIKPYERERLFGVLAEAVRTLSAEEAKIMIRAPRASFEVPIGRIVAAVSEGHSVAISVENDSRIQSNMTFSEIEEELGEDPRFLLCNRGVLVNMDHVTSLKDGILHMRNGERYALRVRGRTALTAKFNQYQITRLRQRTER